MINEVSKFTAFIQQTQTLWAVLLGMFVQFWFGDKKSLRVAATISISSLFVAFYFVPSLIDIVNAITTRMFSFEVGEGSNIAIMFYASSSLISIELMAVLIKILPRAAEERINKYLGVNDATDSK